LQNFNGIKEALQFTLLPKTSRVAKEEEVGWKVYGMTNAPVEDFYAFFRHAQ